MDDLADNGLAGLAASSLARRGFVMSGLISGLMLAATRVQAQVIHTNAEGIDVGAVELPMARCRPGSPVRAAPGRFRPCW